MEANIGLTVAIFFIAILALIFSGMYVFLALTLVSFVFGLIFLGPQSLHILASSILKTTDYFILVAIPMFILMANLLEKSGIAEDLFTTFEGWFGRIRGGLAVISVLVCMVVAAMSGVAGAGVVAVGLVALPVMFKRGYSKDLALGPIAAGGTLGQLIPPSVLFIFYSSLTGVSVAALFKGGLYAGALMGVVFVIYLLIRANLNPKEAPLPPPEEQALPLGRRFLRVLVVIPPILIIVAVLGSIFSGAATPTEAASVGSFATFIIIVIRKRMSRKLLREVCLSTAKVTTMTMFIVLAAMYISYIFTGLGGMDYIQSMVSELAIGPVWIYAISIVILFVLGCFLEPTTVVMITIPILHPIMKSLGVNPVFFGVMVGVVLQCAYITPPMGYSLFYLKGIAPEVTSGEIYSSIWPFVLLQLITIILISLFPETLMGISMWAG